MEKTHCETISYYDELGREVLKNKLKYRTHSEAVKAAKRINIKEGQIYKTVTYKCTVCHMYHIGRNSTKITPKYRNKLFNQAAQKIKSNIPNFKVIGKIEL